jgi:hypothetical protein
MNKHVKELNEMFNKGILPDCLNFSIAPSYEVDLEKLQYNAFYRSYEFAESKFPVGHQSIPGMDKVIGSCQCKQTPLEEMDDIHKEALLKMKIKNQE